MASAISGIRAEWHRFRDDTPGRRFRNHHDRMQHHPRWQRVARTAVGVAVIAVGIVLLFMPGPGVVLLVFGLALIAGQSQMMARWMDRAEPPLETRARAVRRRWRALPRPAKAAIVVGAVALAVAAAYLLWRLWFAG